MTILGYATDNEHEFEDEFGPCIGCGKYVEQLIDERYCSMEKITQQTQPQTKYPGADTSKERLAEITGHLKNYAFAEPDAHESIRDLLAILQERTASLEFYMKQYAAAVKAADVFQCGGPLDNLLTLGQSTLIDGPPAAVKEIERLRQQLHDLRWRQDGSGIWWRPIPPLPKE